jgi:3-hydroxyisobutyrate dehydrogenase-like beta-hydroxyacid dehydrogenase
MLSFLEMSVPTFLARKPHELGDDAMNVGFIGLGAMGQGMAARLLDAGHEVCVWNRSPGAIQALTQRGALSAERPDYLFDADVVITMLSDDDAVRETILDRGLLHTASQKLVHIVMSTLSVSLARELERAHQAVGIAYIAAPVMGRPEAAAGGRLNILAAGEPTLVESVKPLFDAMGQRTWFLGAEPHQANLVKLAMNFLLASAIEAMSEAASLAESYEVDPAKLIEVLTGTLFDAPAYVTYGKLIVEHDFKPGFRLKLGLKDMRLVLRAGEERDVPLPFASLVRDNLIDAIAHGHAESDWSALALVSRRRAGMAQ